MPILKQLILGASGSKRHSRADLTAEMISAPLADFRHMMHIGHGGDAFGDTSFLSAQKESTNQVHKSSLLPRGFRGSKHSQSKRHSSAASFILPANSAISLHVYEDHDLKLHLPKSTSLDFTETNGTIAVMGGRSLKAEEQCFGELSELPAPLSNGGMKHTESMLSFHIDLGPSMLGDILEVMDQTEQERQDITEDPMKDWDVPHLLKSVSTFNRGINEDETPRSETCSPTYNVNINNRDFLFMDEEEDEIRV